MSERFFRVGTLYVRAANHWAARQEALTNAHDKARARGDAVVRVGMPIEITAEAFDRATLPLLGIDPNAEATR